MSDDEFMGRGVCITGGARGLGAGLSRRFAQAGAHVYIGDVLEEQGQALVEELLTEGLSASFHRLDVASEADWMALTDAIGQRAGSLDTLVNNAGLIIRKSMSATSLEEWNLAMAVNVAGVFLGMRYCRPLLVRGTFPAVVNISSTAGLIAHGDPSYTASKWAVRGLTKSAALEFTADQIRVNSIHPATIATPLTEAAPPGHLEANRSAIPMGREASTDEIANIVLFLASSKASFMTGSEVAADGGLTTGGVAHMRARIQQDSAQGIAEP